MNQDRLASGEKTGLLLIHIGDLTFNSHPFFSTEHKYTAQLQQDVREFTKRKLERKFEIAVEKLKVGEIKFF